MYLRHRPRVTKGWEQERRPQPMLLVVACGLTELATTSAVAEEAQGVSADGLPSQDFSAGLDAGKLYLGRERKGRKSVSPGDVSCVSFPGGKAPPHRVQTLLSVCVVLLGPSVTAQEARPHALHWGFLQYKN